MGMLLDTLVQHYSALGPVVLLESQSADHPAASCSYLAALPEAVIKAWDNKIEITKNGKQQVYKDNPWNALSEFRKKWNDWLFGYLGYDLKNHLENLSSNNRDDLEAPDMFFMVPSVLLKMNAKEETVSVIKGSLPDDILLADDKKRISLGEIGTTVDKADYLSMIEKAKQDIFEGRYYEINLSHQLQASFEGSSFKLYKMMRSAGPVPFGSYMQFHDISVCSLSPERFLRKEEKKVFSQPIKGTMKRDVEKKKDQRLVKKLMNSAKNKAENLMIVDLVRNDLSRIAKEGSVNVSDLFQIQTFGTVHQMVSTVSAQTDIENPVDIIKACYPMGSMTGAPKISVMQAIEEYENYRRGIYSGAIGYITPQGDFDFNVVIRTAIIKKNKLFYAVGGAITGDSNPQEEWHETWLKAEALLRAIDT